jgi:hypothetical protein
MADSLHSTPPVSAAGGFAGRTPRPPQKQAPAAVVPGGRDAERATAAERGAVARRVLRERVLACTRELLGVDGHDGAPVFAEAIDTEPVEQFVGRLLSAQNQLAARRVAEWGTARVRRTLDAALRQGAEEAIELLSTAGRNDGQGVLVVAEVMVEYGRLLATLGPNE